MEALSVNEERKREKEREREREREREKVLKKSLGFSEHEEIVSKLPCEIDVLTYYTSSAAAAATALTALVTWHHSLYSRLYQPTNQPGLINLHLS